MEEKLTKYNNKDYSKNFNLIDLKMVQNKFKLIEVKLINEKLYITSQRDEWYVDNSEGYLVLYHKNKWNVTKLHHRENKRFNNIFSVFAYIRKHDSYIYLKNFSQIRMERLFEEISIAR